jgi:predicted anti-sigma-YlaC factor YlaD
MDCEAIRRLMDEDGQDAGVAAHLESCAACRAEAEFRRRVAGAVAAMPRIAAPEGLVARVMAEVQRRPEVVPPVWRGLLLTLRPWELAWIGAACLLLLALLSPFLVRGEWPVPVSMGLPRTPLLTPDPWPLSPTIAAAVWRSLTGSWHMAAEWGRSWIGISAPWLVGAVAFALAFSLLLSWRPGGVRPEGEEAYA